MAENHAFTPREQEIMALAWQCFEGEPKVDYKKLANLAGMGNPVSASNAWAKIKKKIAGQAAASGNAPNGGDSTPKATPSKPKATPKRKKKNEDQDDGEVESPTKKGKGSKGQATAKLAAKVNEEGEREDADGASTIKKEDDDEGMT